MQTLFKETRFPLGFIILTLSPLNKMFSVKFLVFLNFLSASMFSKLVKMLPSVKQL